MTFHEEFEEVYWYVTYYFRNGTFEDTEILPDNMLQQNVKDLFASCVNQPRQGFIPTFNGIKETCINIKQKYSIMKEFMFSAESYRQGISVEQLNDFIQGHYSKKIPTQWQNKEFSLSHKLSVSVTQRQTILLNCLTATIIVNRLLKQDAIKALQGELK